MQIKKTELSPTSFKLEITADVEFINNVKQATLRHLAAKHVKLAGFRSGKAPLSLVEKQVDPNLLQQEFLEEAVNRLYGQALKQENIRAISQPKINLKKFVPFTELVFEAEVEAIGPIKLANYKNLKVQKSTVSITEKDIKGVLSELSTRLAERKDVEVASKLDDEVTIDFKGTDEKGNPIQGADSQDYPIVLGSKTFIPGFEENLVGLKPGEEKTFKITFPSDYQVKALASKKVNFWIKVKKVSQVVEPKQDDKFAAKAGPFKTLAELKADIKKQLTLERQNQADREYENNLVQNITERTNLVVPKALVEDQVLRAEQAEKQNLMYRGQTWQEHLKEEGVTEEEHRKRNESEAETKVKAGLVLSEIARLENISVSNEEVNLRINLLKGQYKDQAMQAELDKPENQEEIANRLLTEKTLSRLVELNK